ncbi:MAG TPA: SPOR domain-containing protein [Gaiellaceae bacterium]|nr:SPOR domain-containing protein [Gaiellaceae bacterium]
MARDDWRIRIELEPEHAGGFLERLGIDLGSRARELARELEEQRLPVSRDDDTLFVYAASRLQARQARQVVEAELDEAQIEPRLVRIEHWLDDEERWDSEPADDETWEEDVLERGYAPWEVRVECVSHDAADELADRLQQEGLEVVRRWRYLVIGASTREEAEMLAQRLHGDAQPGGEVVWEAMPRNPFAIFGGFGG